MTPFVAAATAAVAHNLLSSFSFRFVMSGFSSQPQVINCEVHLLDLAQLQKYETVSLLKDIVTFFGHAEISGSFALWLYLNSHAELKHKAESWKPGDIDIWLPDVTYDDPKKLVSFVSHLKKKNFLYGDNEVYSNGPVIQVERPKAQLMYQERPVSDLPICEVSLLVDKAFVHQFDHLKDYDSKVKMQFIINSQTLECIRTWSCPYPSIYDTADKEEVRDAIGRHEPMVSEFISKHNPTWGPSQYPEGLAVFHGGCLASSIIARSVWLCKDSGSNEVPMDVYSLGSKLYRGHGRVSKYASRGVTFTSSHAENYRAFARLVYLCDIPYEASADLLFKMVFDVVHKTERLTNSGTIKPAKK